MTLGLPYEKEANQLNLEQRKLLLSLGHKVLETAIIAKYNLKSYENNEHYEICKKNLDNIGKAYNIIENTSEILRIENLPDLKTLFLSEKLDFETVFTLRHLASAKYYRKWINSIGENSDAQEITRECLNEIKGSKRFFNTNSGKFFKNLGMFGVSTALGAAIAGPAGAVAGFGLGLLDTFVLENLLKGKNPSMFIEDIRQQTKNRSKMNI